MKTLREKLQQLKDTPMLTQRKGDIVLSYENTFFSWVVRTITSSKWSHVGIYVGDIVHLMTKDKHDWILTDTEDEIQQTVNTAQEMDINCEILRNVIVSAVPGRGVSFTDFDTVENKAVFEVLCITKLQREQVLKAAISRYGQVYDYWQIIILIYRILTDTLQTNKGDAFPDKYVCSELVAESFYAAGYSFGKIIDNVLPETIAQSSLTRQIS